MSNLNHRKATQKLQFVNEAGQVLANTDVQMKLTNHELEKWISIRTK